MSTLTSISPLSGPPGTVVTVTGAGFTAGSVVACPVIAATQFVSSTQLTATIPAGIQGPTGGSMAIAVWVVDPDGTASTPLAFTVKFAAAKLQAWTSVDDVCCEVPGFERGGKIDDGQIQTWIESIAQELNGLMLRRGLPMDPAGWQQPTTAGTPTAGSLLEMLNRFGAAARLAAAVASLFSQQDWPIRKNLQAAYDDAKKALLNGDYDKLFLPSAATLEPGPQFGGGGMTNDFGWTEASFRKEQKF